MVHVSYVGLPVVVVGLLVIRVGCLCQVESRCVSVLVLGVVVPGRLDVGGRVALTSSPVGDCMVLVLWCVVVVSVGGVILGGVCLRLGSSGRC